MQFFDSERDTIMRRLFVVAPAKLPNSRPSKILEGFRGIPRESVGAGSYGLYGIGSWARIVAGHS